MKKSNFYFFVSCFLFLFAQIEFAQIDEIQKTLERSASFLKKDSGSLSKSNAFGSSLTCNINIACDPKGFTDISNGIFWFNGCSAFFIANTSFDGRLLFITANHVFPSSVLVGGTTTVSAKFNYQSSTCENPTNEPSSTSLNITVKLLVRYSTGDWVLAEIINNNFLPSILVTLLGWDRRYSQISLATASAIIGHPKADIKKVAFSTINSTSPEYTYTKIEQGNGAVESGYSGAPIIGKDAGGKFYVYGVVVSGSIYGCSNNPQSYVNASNIVRGWNEVKTYLDPTNSGVEYFDGMLSALPVQLISFTASLADNDVQLNWQTATEVNNYGFNIERRVQGADWEKVGFVRGYGNSNSPKSYSFTDNSVLASKVQYRLKQIDFDGKFEYSKIVEVNIEAPARLMLYQNSPNPFNPTTEIKFSLPKSSNVELCIYNLLGEKVYTLANGMMNAGEHRVVFDASNFSSGVYIYILNSEISLIRKMVLMK